MAVLWIEKVCRTPDEWNRYLRQLADENPVSIEAQRIIDDYIEEGFVSVNRTLRTATTLSPKEAKELWTLRKR